MTKHTRLGSAKKDLACANVKCSLQGAIATGKFINDALFGPVCGIQIFFSKYVSPPINIKYELTSILGVTKDTTTTPFVSRAHAM